MKDCVSKFCTIAFRVRNLDNLNAPPRKHLLFSLWVEERRALSTFAFSARPLAILLIVSGSFVLETSSSCGPVLSLGMLPRLSTWQTTGKLQFIICNQLPILPNNSTYCCWGRVLGVYLLCKALFKCVQRFVRLWL